MRTVIVVTALAVAAPLSAQLLPQALPMPRSRPGAPVVTVTDIALAYTAGEDQTRLEIEPWDASGPALGEMLGARIDYFLVEPAPIVIANGGRFELANLRVSAFGLNGDPLHRAPLKLSLEAPDGVLSLELALDNQTLFALRPGYARLWVEALLPRGTGTGEHYRLPVVVLVR